MNASQVGDAIKALEQLARNVGRIASGDSQPDGLEGLAMSIGNPRAPLSESVDRVASALERIVDELESLAARPDGLIGLWGHELSDGYAERQFRVTRRLGDGRWLLCLYSWIDGDATTLEACDEAKLLDPAQTRLYLDNQHMRDAYEHGGMRRPDHLLNGDR